MNLRQRVDFRELDRLVGIGAQEARRSGEGEAISRWCAADRDGAYLARLVYHVGDLLSLDGAPPGGFHLLDAGGGSGLLSVIACLMGASRAVVIDTNRHLMDFLQTVSPRLAPAVKVEGHLRDTAQTGLPDSSIDIVLCNEALSHMFDIEGFMREVRRVLKPGGRLVISDSNNESNPMVRRARIREWDKFERPATAGSEPGELFAKRLELIAQSFPGMDRVMALDAALATFGMTGPEVVDSARARLAGLPVVESRYDGSRCPVDPVSNQCADRLFKPYDLSHRLTRHGLKPRVRAHFATVPPFRAVNPLWGVMSPLTVPFSKAFRIVAVRKDGA